tara:strand:+ start:33 stop:203 length:171 start_codon:yes stop_codon:yes gene_type:complete
MANGKIGFFLTKFREARANKKMWKNIRKKARKHKSWKKITFAQCEPRILRDGKILK